MDDLYIEEFANIPRGSSESVQKVLPSISKPQEVSTPITAYRLMKNLEDAIRKECKRPERLLLYIEDLRKSLEDKDLATALHYTDTIEEFLDLELSNS